MIFLKTTKLPLWYIAGILIVILLGIINYLGLKNAMVQTEMDMILLFQYLDFVLIGVWFVVNIVMIAYLSSVNAENHDFIPPFYFIGVHLVYLTIILMSNNGYKISTTTATHMSMITSGFEILLAGLFLSPYLINLNEDKHNNKKKFNKKDR
ncbi:MAG: hypothetical protein ACLFTR_05030 [Candidatus Woesearchaeota archaeon]